jgi:predicted TIM-barrel fold metal-dependent hydrolase
MAGQSSMVVIDGDMHIIEPEAHRSFLQPHVRDAFAGRKQAATTGRYHPLWGDLENTGNLKVPADAHEYLADMDAIGIDVAVLYRTYLGWVGLVREAAAAVAVARRYNDWLADLCRTAPDRLKGVAVVAPQDVPTAVRELHRAVEQLGFVGVVLPTWIPGRYLSDTAFDPLYAAAADLGVPIGFHAGAPTEAMPRRFADHLSTHAIAHTTEQMAAVCSIVVGGVLERHPTLRVAFLESGIGWVPYWLERLDGNYAKLGGEVPFLIRKPSEYLLSGRCYFHTEPDERGLPYAIQVLGDELIMWSSDYPHWDCAFPDSARLLQQRTDLSEASKRKLLGENAARFYRLEVGAEANTHAGSPA